MHDECRYRAGTEAGDGLDGGGMEARMAGVGHIRPRLEGCAVSLKVVSGRARSAHHGLWRSKQLLWCWKEKSRGRGCLLDDKYVVIIFWGARRPPSSELKRAAERGFIRRATPEADYDMQQLPSWMNHTIQNSKTIIV